MHILYIIIYKYMFVLYLDIYTYTRVIIHFAHSRAQSAATDSTEHCHSCAYMTYTSCDI